MFPLMLIRILNRMKGVFPTGREHAPATSD